MFNSNVIRGLLAGATLLVGISSAQAATLALSYSETASGTTGPGTVTNITPPDTYYFGNSYSSNLASTIPTTSFEFYDDYVFTVTSSTVNSVTTTISLGSGFIIDNFQGRIYNTSGNPTLPVLGAPFGGEIAATTVTSGIVTNVIFSPLSLSAGTYVLELRGNVSGSNGGSYAGVMNVEPVPVPGAVWLMGSAVLGLVGARRRR